MGKTNSVGGPQPTPHRSSTPVQKTDVDRGMLATSEAAASIYPRSVRGVNNNVASWQKANASISSRHSVKVQTRSAVTRSPTVSSVLWQEQSSAAPKKKSGKKHG